MRSIEFLPSLRKNFIPKVTLPPRGKATEQSSYFSSSQILIVQLKKKKKDSDQMRITHHLSPPPNTTNQLPLNVDRQKYLSTQ